MRIDNSFLVASRLSNTLPQLITPKDDENEEESSFQTIFRDLWEATSETSAASRENTARLLTGTLEDFPEYMVTGEKSSIMFEMNLAVRSKVIDAYTEIMRTPV